MPPFTATTSIADIPMGQRPADFLSSQQYEDPKTTPGADCSDRSHLNSTRPHRLDVKTHVFKKEMQEYLLTQNGDRHRIETIIYVDLSIAKQDDDSLIKMYDYVCISKDLLFSLPDKVIPLDVMASKRILNVDVNLKSPSNDWRIEQEACARCIRRMSTKLDQDEVRIMHILPELYRTENGDALIHFRNGVANIQLKVNCYCGHKMEKEGFVVCFESQSDASIAPHGTSPLMFYHENKNRIAARAAAAAAKAEAKAEKLRLQQEARSKARSAVKSVSGKAKRTPRKNSIPGHSEVDPTNHFIHHIPSPPDSSFNSPVGFSVSPELCESADISFTAPSPTLTDPMSSLFPELVSPSIMAEPYAQQQQQVQQDLVAMVSHMTPDNGPTRGGTLVTIHGSGFSVGEMMYVCFGETFVPVIPQHSQMVECYTPARNKAETVAVFALHSTVPTNIPAQCTFTYVDDNEKELVKLALQRIMAISARMDGPLESVMSRANELLMWSDVLGVPGNLDESSTQRSSFSNLEAMIMKSLTILDSLETMDTQGLSISNNTRHTMLHLAVALGYKTLARDLIIRGIDVQAKDKNGHTAQDLARILNDQFMLDIFDSTELRRKPGTLQGSHRVQLTSPMDISGDKTAIQHSVLQLQMDHEHESHGQNLNDGSSVSDSLSLENQRLVRDQREHAMVADMGRDDVLEPHSVCQNSQGATVDIGGQNHDRLLARGVQGVSARLTADIIGGQVVVVRRCNNNNGGSVDPAQQAAVQSSRHDAESEPILYLGGVPVARRVVSRETMESADQDEDTMSSDETSQA
ncbi:MAG: hypothetical protein J3Q66DRAFT_435926 [Benniella sp.]|nr:MAG: hypothetical protein J3Q66DRAFT_435926 [Benniella sp.]